MDRALLAARIQEILKGRSSPAQPESAPPAGADTAAQPRRSHGEGGPPCDEEAAFAARCAADEAASAARDVLGAETIDGPAGACLVIEQRYAASHIHGRHAVGRYASATAAALHALPWFLRAGSASGDPVLAELPLEAVFAPPRLLFFDLETTGLSGGAGTYAFLVGCAWFDGADLLTRQFFLRGYGEERALLEAVRAFVEGPPQTSSLLHAASCQPPRLSSLPAASCQLPAVLITYNGRAFDLPLIETRYLFHRRESPFTEVAHVDMLFSARRLWSHRPTRQTRAAFDGMGKDTGDLRSSCALTALEQDILGLQRYDDVPGWEIPARYFAYTRTGDARGLVAVLEHNRLDLLSLAAITGVILEMVSEREKVVHTRYDCLALARLLDYLRREEEAERSYERVAEPDGLVEGEFDRLARAEALHWLALHRRRARRFVEAAEAWRALLQVPGLDVDARREACEALAIHHEHRAKDLETAQAFARRALDVARGGRYAPDVEHRLDRLSRKLGARGSREGRPPRQSVFNVEDP
jgi:uncharacterized protein YprB with RNaseH-like and TPR domain